MYCKIMLHVYSVNLYRPTEVILTAEKKRGVSAMEYRRMRRTGFNVSEIGLGGEHLINRSTKEVEAVVKTALGKWY